MVVGQQGQDVMQSARKGIRIKRLLLSLLAILLIIALAITGVSYYVGYSLIHPQRNLQYLNLTPADYHIPYQNVTFYSRRDHIKLDGWEMRTVTTQHRWVIISHGYASNRLFWGEDTFRLYQFFLQQGYNIATFDYSDSGKSGGNTSTVGIWEQADLLGALDDLEQQDPQASIGLYGISQGAAVSLLIAGQHTHVSFVIADSSFADLHSFLSTNLPTWSHLPTIPFTPVILLLVQAMLQQNIDNTSPLKALASFHGPILLTHSRADQSIPVANSRQIYAAYKGKKDITYKEFAISSHAHEFVTEHATYVAALKAFLAHVNSVAMPLKT